MLKIKSVKHKLIIIALVVIFSLCGCSKRDIKSDGKIIFTDALDREIILNEKPKRTAALIGSFADIWMLAGGTVCAAAEDAWEDFGLKLENCINIGGAHSPSLEKLLSANPDFVIASASTASNVRMKENLKNAGITVAYFDVDNFEDYLHMLDICTDITGRKDLYEQNGLEIKEQINRIINNTHISSENEILVLRTSSGSVKAKGSEGTVLGEILNDFGCVNIADEDKSLLENLSAESVIAKNPHHIFVVTMGNEEKAMESLSRMLRENPAWGTLEAVKENRMYVMERKLFNLKPNAKWSEAYERISNILLSESKQN